MLNIVVSQCILLSANARRHVTETMLCRIRSKLLRCYETSVEHQRVSDSDTSPSHLEDMENGGLVRVTGRRVSNGRGVERQNRLIRLQH